MFDTPMLEVLAPLMFVVGTLYLLGPTLPMSRTLAREFVFLSVWGVVAYYLVWRVGTTVLPADGEWYEVGWVWFCFGIEVLALIDALILYIAFQKKVDRTPEADRHEERLRATPADLLPRVDVYIPTYNEPFEVLEKTITGALCLDYPNFDVWVLDDGRRPWLKAFCESKGVGYITRPDNAHAKAGNINHALTKTNADFIALFDADFIVQRNFLMRTMGFFEDPKIGIVQTPHAFYNPDPMQTNLAVRKALPDDQRFFFEAIMPARDAWDAAFCCGSNSVTRREALRSIGDALPTESITEDQLLTLKLLRKGYITRYLCEPLAYGLAPEGLQAFFIQRSRWARGAMQILYLDSGPLGKGGLSFMQRALFMPTHWLIQSLTFFLGVFIPVLFLWTGILPMVNVTIEGILHYLAPMIVAMVGGVCLFAPKQYFPLAVQVLGTFQSFKLLPEILVTLVKPFGYAFKVTPKGGDARSGYDPLVFWTSASLIALTVVGITINLVPEWRIISQAALIPVVATWSAINVIVLFLVCMMSLQGNARRGEERFASDDPVWIVGPGDAQNMGRLSDISLSGAGIVTRSPDVYADHVGERLKVFITEVGFVPGTVVRTSGELVGIHFDLLPGIERDLLIRRLFTSGDLATNIDVGSWEGTAAVLRSIWATPTHMPLPAPEQSGALAAKVAPAKLPAASLVVMPEAGLHDWEEEVAQRREVA